MILQGNLICLRSLAVEDAEITLKWRQSEQARFLNRGANTVEEQREWIEANIIKDEFNFIIEFRGMPVGTYSIYNINRLHQSGTIGRLIIGEREWVRNAPVVHEAGVLLYDYAFGELGLHKIYGEIIEENIGMINLRHYLGFHQDGILRDHFRDGETYKNIVVLSMLSDEYWVKCRPRLVSLIKLFEKFSQISPK
jgi:diamine N-acetyltransferase